MKIQFEKDNMPTQEELKSKLSSYKKVINEGLYEYLDDLVNLEYSVVRNYITEEQRKALSELDIYKQIATYNIYNRALNIAKGRKRLTLSEGINNLSICVKIENGEDEIFKFHRQSLPIGVNVPEEYKTLKIGEITFYKRVEGVEQRLKELYNTLEELIYLYDKKNPYHSDGTRYGGPASRWAFNHMDEIKGMEKKYERLDAKKTLTDKEQKIIADTERYRKELLNDYLLQDADFTVDITKRNSYGKMPETHRVLLKEMPNLEIKSDITYI